jgi:hypothetical protein
MILSGHIFQAVFSLQPESPNVFCMPEQDSLQEPDYLLSLKLCAFLRYCYVVSYFYVSTMRLDVCDIVSIFVRTAMRLGNYHVFLPYERYEQHYRIVYFVLSYKSFFYCSLSTVYLLRFRVVSI